MRLLAVLARSLAVLARSLAAHHVVAAAFPGALAVLAVCFAVCFAAGLAAGLAACFAACFAAGLAACLAAAHHGGGTVVVGRSRAVDGRGITSSVGHGILDVFKEAAQHIVAARVTARSLAVTARRTASILTRVHLIHW